MRGLVTIMSLFAVSVTLGACDLTDPYTRPGMWQPTGANALNLAAMAQNPHDLIRGRGTSGALGVEAVTPIQALLAGRPAPLTTATAQSAVSVTTAAAPSGGPQ